MIMIKFNVKNEKSFALFKRIFDTRFARKIPKALANRYVRDENGKMFLKNGCVYVNHNLVVNTGRPNEYVWSDYELITLINVKTVTEIPEGAEEITESNLRSCFDRLE